MNCPPAIAAIVLQILHRGILSARIRGWAKDAEGAALEANHVHSLPDLLLNYSREKLEFYWEAERASYVRAQRKLGYPQADFKNLWQQLELADPTLKSDEEIARDTAKSDRTRGF